MKTGMNWMVTRRRAFILFIGGLCIFLCPVQGT